MKLSKPWLFANSETLLSLLLALVVFLACSTGQLDYLLQDEHGLSAPARSYLDIERWRAEHLLVTVSALEELLAVSQETSAGVSFIVDANVKLGEIVSVLRRATQYTSYVSFGAVIGLSLLEATLQLSGSIAKPILILCAVSWVLFLTAKLLGAGVIKFKLLLVSRTLSLILVAAHIVVPGSIYLAAATSNTLTAKTKTETIQNFQNIHGDVSRHHQNQNLKTNVKSTIGGIEHHYATNNHHTGNALVHAAGYAAAFLLDLIILPLGFLYLLLIASNRLLHLSIDPKEVQKRLEELQMETRERQGGSGSFYTATREVPNEEKTI